MDPTSQKPQEGIPETSMDVSTLESSQNILAQNSRPPSNTKPDDTAGANTDQDSTAVAVLNSQDGNYQQMNNTAAHNPLPSEQNSNDTPPTNVGIGNQTLVGGSQNINPSSENTEGIHSNPSLGQNDSESKITRGATRLFVGNLKSEVVTKRDFRDIWEKYGEVSEVAIHRSFGFVQFVQPEDLEAALKAEQGRIIGGKPIDLQPAKSEPRRGSNRGSGPRDRRPRRQEGRERGGRDDRRGRGRQDYRRSRSRSRDRRRDDRDRGSRRDSSRSDKAYRGGSGRREILSPINGAVVTLILLGEQQRSFAENACSNFRAYGIPYEIVMLDGRTLGQALRDAEANRSRYALIVGRDNARKQQITAKMLYDRESGRCPTFELTIPELTERVVRAERELGFLDPSFAPQPQNVQVQPNSLLGIQGSMPTSGLSNQQQSLNSLSSLLQSMQSQQTVQPAVQPTTVASSLSSVAQQLQSLQQQISQISPEQRQQLLSIQNSLQHQNIPNATPGQNYVGQYPSQNQQFTNQVRQQQPYQSAPQPALNTGYNKPNPNEQSRMSELSRLLNTLQQKSK